MQVCGYNSKSLVYDTKHSILKDYRKLYDLNTSGNLTPTNLNSGTVQSHVKMVPKLLRSHRKLHDQRHSLTLILTNLRVAMVRMS